MTFEQLVASAMALSEIKRLTLPTDQGGLALTVNELKQTLEARVPSVINETAAVYEWDFALKETTEDTVANQSNYTLKGDSKKDAMNIASIRYETQKRLLDKHTIVSMDQLESRHTISSPGFWVRAGRAGAFPIVRIISTPLSSGIVMTYRYWRTGITLDQFPPVLDYLLTIVLAKRMLPNMNQGIYDKAVSDAIDTYERGGGEVDITVQDPMILGQNNRRANMFGWGGTR